MTNMLKFCRSSLLGLSAAMAVSIIPLATLVPPTIANSEQIASQFTTFRSPASFPIRFSIQYPLDWTVDTSHQNYIIITNYQADGSRSLTPDQAIKTDISIDQKSLESIVQRSQGSHDESGSRVIRRGRINLGGRDGFRLWTTDSLFDFPDTITTYLRYTDTQTIVIVSFYTASNPTAVPLIQRIHGSFRLMTPQQ
ncbi:MAG: PsbP-related protein [Cyanobacteriota bacterium SKYGB_h_bin112]|nr:PsbP-related protein [Cyanobacteriota bacterium SKYGB_h_bin112]